MAVAAVGEGDETLDSLKDTLRGEQRAHTQAFRKFVLEDETLSPILIAERCRAVGGGQGKLNGLQFQGSMRIEVTTKTGAQTDALPTEWNAMPIEAVQQGQEATVRLKIVEVSGTPLLEEDVWRGYRVAELKGKLDTACGDWALEETLYLGPEKQDDDNTLDDVPDNAVLCLVTSRRTVVTWNSSLDVKRRSASLENFEPKSIVEYPLVRAIMGKACCKGSSSSWTEAEVSESLVFEPHVEATEALAAVPNFAGKDYWVLQFTDGSALGSVRGSDNGPLYSAIENEERRLKNLGLELAEEESGHGPDKGWRVGPPLQPY